MTSGLRSIISVWLCRVSITVLRVMPAGNAVTVVKCVFFDMVKDLVVEKKMEKRGFLYGFKRQ